MKRFLKTLIILAAVSIFAQTSANATGLFYTDATYPLTATGIKVEDLSKLKKGTASTKNILYIFEAGDAGIDTAAKNGNIKRISHIDVNEKTIFIFWRKITVTVYGN